MVITNQQKKSTILYTALGSSLLLIFGGVFLFKTRQKSQKQELIIEKLEAKENERNRLAGNVHDSLAGSLRTAMIRVDNLNKELKNDALYEVGDTIELAYNKARTISKEYQKLNFDTITFKNYIKSLLFERQELYQITIDDVGIDTVDWKTINTEIKTEFYRILQEALLNIHKHANAKNVTVAFSLDKKNVQMNIKDDGLGMDISESFESVGLSNIQSRIEDLNGKLKIDSSPNNGFELMVFIPV
ncbi:MAG: hypothetical protein COA67_04665 [Lutibacter sp.]|nr:MAG: hypothetical protein COA67_04665 [Lutibacter sp.]